MQGNVTDERIIELLVARDEQALTLIERAYKALIFRICGNILYSREDVEECYNNVLTAVWSKIPPEKPASLPAFLSFLARTTAIDRLRENSAAKRGGGTLPFEELDNLFASPDTAQEYLEEKSLTDALNDFLAGLKESDRRLFLRRYYFAESVEKIAQDRGVSKRMIYKQLKRLKETLEMKLNKEGFIL